jgi:nucleotidyltransferase substrate binding protein (TIGR01987 family)
MPQPSDITRYGFFAKLTALPFVEAIYLYGSRARGDNQARSDVDLAVLCPTASDAQWAEIQELVNQEQIDTLLGIDLKRYDTLPDDRFKSRLDRDKQVLYQRREDGMDDELWQDSFADLSRALDRFAEILAEPVDAKTYVLDAAIQRFEFCIELYWKTLKRMLLAIAGEDMPFPKLVFDAAYRLGWIGEEALWIAALKDRNYSAHVYSEAQARDIYSRLAGHYQLMRRTYADLQTRFQK